MNIMMNAKSQVLVLSGDADAGSVYEVLPGCDNIATRFTIYHI